MDNVNDSDCIELDRKYKIEKTNSSGTRVVNAVRVVKTVQVPEL